MRRDDKDVLRNRAKQAALCRSHISHKQAIEKAEKEFAIHRKREMDLLESDFDKEIKKLNDNKDKNSE